MLPPSTIPEAVHHDIQDLTDASGRHAAAAILDTLLRRGSAPDCAAAGGGDSRWWDALTELAARVHSSPGELCAALMPVVRDLYEEGSLQDVAEDGAPQQPVPVHMHSCIQHHPNNR